MSCLISFAWANSGCKERKPIITKWKILAHSGTRTHLLYTVAQKQVHEFYGLLYETKSLFYIDQRIVYAKFNRSADTHLKFEVGENQQS